MRPITFSRQFPGYHPRKGEPTYFVEKILNQLDKGRYDLSWRKDNYIQVLYKLNEEKIKEGKLTHAQVLAFYRSLNKDITDCKPHTIRAGNRWKQGQSFSPRIWSGRPYFDPQIIFAPPVVIKKTWDFEIKNSMMLIEDKDIVIVEYRELIARHDGLAYQDFKDWFKWPQPFSGQIICWDENVNY